MAIDNAVLKKFYDEELRPFADRLAGLKNIPVNILDSFVGKGLCEVVGTTPEDLLRVESWGEVEYGAIAVETVTGSDAGNRTLLTNHDGLMLLRVAVVLRNLMAANPELGALLGKIAVNPRG